MTPAEVLGQTRARLLEGVLFASELWSARTAEGVGCQADDPAAARWTLPGMVELVARGDEPLGRECMAYVCAAVGLATRPMVSEWGAVEAWAEGLNAGELSHEDVIAAVELAEELARAAQPSSSCHREGE